MEFVLEGGIFAVAILAVGGLILALALMRAFGAARRRDLPQLLFCISSIAVVALHSVVDYPLRSMALAHLTAIAVGMVVAIATRPADAATREYSAA
jgi:hypothetical protein